MDMDMIYRKSGSAFGSQWNDLADKKTSLAPFATQLAFLNQTSQLNNVLDLMKTLDSDRLDSSDLRWIDYIQSQLRLLKEYPVLKTKLKKVFNQAVDTMDSNYDDLQRQVDDYHQKLIPFLQTQFIELLEQYSQLVANSAVLMKFKSEVNKLSQLSNEGILYLFLKDSLVDVLKKRLFNAFDMVNDEADLQLQYVNRLTNAMVNDNLKTTALIMVIDAQLQRWLADYATDINYEFLGNYQLSMRILQFEFPYLVDQFEEVAALNNIFKFMQYMEDSTFINLRSLNELSISKDRGNLELTYSFMNADFLRRFITYELIQVLKTLD